MRLSAKIVVGVRPRLGRRPGGGLFRLGEPIGPDAPVPFYGRNKLNPMDICRSTGPGGQCTGPKWLNNVDLNPAAAARLG